MKITWDERKRVANLDKHGFDFADLDESFFAEAVILPGKQGRLRAIGVNAEHVVAVIFATLGREGLSVVSMRPASKTERSLWRGED